MLPYAKESHANHNLMWPYAMCAGKCEGTQEADNLDLDPPNSNLHGTNPRLNPMPKKHKKTICAGECEGGEEVRLHLAVSCLFFHWRSHQWSSHHQSVQVTPHAHTDKQHHMCRWLISLHCLRQKLDTAYQLMNLPTENEFAH